MRRLMTIASILVLSVVAGCGSGGYGDPEYEVISTQVAEVGETTQDVRVWAPDAEGSWPVVYAVPGAGGDARRDFEVFATELAGQGVIVFATNWRTISGSTSDLEKDVECGYRASRAIADEYGGDLSQPVTVVGFSMGATSVMNLGINEATMGPGGRFSECFTGEPRPEVIVALNGCHREATFPAGVDTWGNPDAHFILVSSDGDEVCGTEETAHAETWLLNKGYDVGVVEIPDASHGELIFHDDTNREWTELPNDHPPGREAVQVVLDAIEAAQQ